MAEPYLHLSQQDQLEVLSVGASRSGRPISKAYGAIRRFSEDIDVTYDIRAFAPELVQNAGEEALPPNSSQEGKWTKAIRKKLPAWVTKTAVPIVQQRLEQEKLSATVRADEDCLYLEYTAAASGYGYTAPRVMVEFGARSTGEPCSAVNVNCDVAPFVEDVIFPKATPRVMNIDRTFWEKLTAIHLFCQRGEIKDRLARHWYDIYMLDLHGHADAALKNKAIAEAVAKHKSWFFAAKDASGSWIDYMAAVNGGLQLVPEGTTLDALAVDYKKMVTDGLLLEEAKPFEELIERCRAIQDRANS